MSFEDFLTSIDLFIQDYWPLIALAVIILVAIGIKKIRQLRFKRQGRKIEKLSLQSKQRPLAQKIEKVPEEAPRKSTIQEIERDFQEWFRSNDDKKRDRQNLILDISTTVNQLKAEDSMLDVNIGNDIEQLKQKILDIGDKKEQIRKYGRQLAILYDKYEEREQQLGLMLVGMEKLAPQKKDYISQENA